MKTSSRRGCFWFKNGKSPVRWLAQGLFRCKTGTSTEVDGLSGRHQVRLVLPGRGVGLRQRPLGPADPGRDCLAGRGAGLVGQVGVLELDVELGLGLVDRRRGAPLRDLDVHEVLEHLERGLPSPLGQSALLEEGEGRGHLALAELEVSLLACRVRLVLEALEEGLVVRTGGAPLAVASLADDAVAVLLLSHDDSPSVSSSDLDRRRYVHSNT
jgi:hypothetical protein